MSTARPMRTGLLNLPQRLRFAIAKTFLDDSARLPVGSGRKPPLLGAKTSLFPTQSTLLRPELAHLLAKLPLTLPRLAL